MSTSSSTPLNRRTVLSAAAGVAGVAALSPLLTACGGGAGGGSGANTKHGLAAALPSYVPRNSVKADIPSVNGNDGATTDPGFTSYPTSLTHTVTKTPGSGGKYTAVTPLWGAIPQAGNAYYQAVNKALGADVTVKPANGNTYNTTVPPLAAAHKMPSWIQLPTWWNQLFNVGELAPTQFADLTPYLAGDKVKDYPNLAAIPTGGWQAGVWHNKLYGIPSFTTGATYASVLYYRKDVFDAKGIDLSVKSTDDLLALGKELTSKSARVWAFDDVWTYLFAPFEIPWQFRVDDGKLVHKYETQEMLEALAFANKLAKSGYMHPNAISNDTSDAKNRFYAGQALISCDGTGAWNGADADSGIAAHKSYRRAAMPLFSHDGKGKPSIFLSSSASEISYLNKKLTPKQIKECLRIADYLAAPFGSYEYTLVNFGVENVDWTMGAQGPEYTDKGKKESNQDTYQFLASPRGVISNPSHNQVTQDYCAWAAQTVKHAYKPVFWNMNIAVPTQYATANGGQEVEDTIIDVIHGHKPVSAFQDAVSTWRKHGGNQLVAWYDKNVYQKYGTGQ
jgi:putative aldouronate transport system substrate-binding protein